jgi:hypothetical protein
LYWLSTKRLKMSEKLKNFRVLAAKKIFAVFI